MELIDNISRLLGDDLKQTLKPGAKLKVAASCFSMYAYEALKAEFEKKLHDDPAFAKDPAARLDFFYRRSPSWDAGYGLYPVLRSDSLPPLL